MVYQDHLTKFCILRPLTSKRASEVAYQLLDIYLLLGSPSILQSDNGSEFTAQVITELNQMWPDLVIIHRKPRHPQSQGSVERANCDIKDMLIAWMSDNDTRDWTVGLKFVQFQKNSSHHTRIKRSPFAALFGADAKVGLTSSSLPQDVIARLQTEDALLSAVPIQTQSSNPARKQNMYQSHPSLYVRRKFSQITTLSIPFCTFQVICIN
ncbi:KRAB-A domain-containing protein 2-like [Gigantopelta aegis]|uniref:KRAB-A domain-containing protein 2-like n=1 Tax=Gigantopelta aegis TaxID=1735272 RepID=UPI001B888833|nr:KRAB-A domain-containing protein 2-like [Gigantopelta aegis]